MPEREQRVYGADRAQSTGRQCFHRSLFFPEASRSPWWPSQGPPAQPDQPDGRESPEHLSVQRALHLPLTPVPRAALDARSSQDVSY